MIQWYQQFNETALSVTAMQCNFWDLTTELKRENKAMKNGCPGNLAMRQLTSFLKVSTLCFLRNLQFHYIRTKFPWSSMFKNKAAVSLRRSPTSLSRGIFLHWKPSVARALHNSHPTPHEETRLKTAPTMRTHLIMWVVWQASTCPQHLCADNENASDNVGCVSSFILSATLMCRQGGCIRQCGLCDKL